MLAKSEIRAINSGPPEWTPDGAARGLLPLGNMKSNSKEEEFFYSNRL
jgi:hypothetical protein